MPRSFAIASIALAIALVPRVIPDENGHGQRPTRESSVSIVTENLDEGVIHIRNTGRTTIQPCRQHKGSAVETRFYDVDSVLRITVGYSWPKELAPFGPGATIQLRQAAASGNTSIEYRADRGRFRLRPGTAIKRELQLWIDPPDTAADIQVQPVRLECDTIVLSQQLPSPIGFDALPYSVIYSIGDKHPRERSKWDPEGGFEIHSDVEFEDTIATPLSFASGNAFVPVRGEILAPNSVRSIHLLVASGDGLVDSGLTVGLSGTVTGEIKVSFSSSVQGTVFSPSELVIRAPGCEDKTVPIDWELELGTIQLQCE